MAEDKVTRKLTTILAADVEEYTRLMRADEEATLKTLGEYREIFDNLIARHDGRVFSAAGDSVLAEFGSAVEAVRCAISCQEETSSRNAELADDRKLIFRIGINVGDVMIRDGDLFGDGVNVAARLEGLADPGGVCISGSVFEQIKHKLSLGFEDMGQQKVKNISEPVSAYRLVPGRVSVSAAAATSSRVRHWRIPAMAAAVVLIVAVGGLAIWRPWEPGRELLGDVKVQQIRYKRDVTLTVGQSTVIHGARGECGQPPPAWDRVVRNLPQTVTGSFSDGGTGTRRSRRCGGLTPARAVRFTAEKAGSEQIELYGDPINITVK